MFFPRCWIIVFRSCCRAHVGYSASIVAKMLKTGEYDYQQVSRGMRASGKTGFHALLSAPAYQGVADPAHHADQVIFPINAGSGPHDLPKLGGGKWVGDAVVNLYWG